MLANFLWGFFGFKKHLYHFQKNFSGKFFGLKKKALFAKGFFLC
jgi:hypothetical protein